MSASIAVASEGNIFFYTSRTDSGQDIRALTAEMTAPLPQHHPQLLYQALLQGELIWFALYVRFTFAHL